MHPHLQNEWFYANMLEGSCKYVPFFFCRLVFSSAISLVMKPRWCDVHLDGRSSHTKSSNKPKLCALFLFVRIIFRFIHLFFREKYGFNEHLKWFRSSLSSNIYWFFFFISFFFGKMIEFCSSTSRKVVNWNSSSMYFFALFLLLRLLFSHSNWIIYGYTKWCYQIWKIHCLCKIFGFFLIINDRNYTIFHANLSSGLNVSTSNKVFFAQKSSTLDNFNKNQVKRCQGVHPFKYAQLLFFQFTFSQFNSNQASKKLYMFWRRYLHVTKKKVWYLFNLIYL